MSAEIKQCKVRTTDPQDETELAYLGKPMAVDVGRERKESRFRFSYHKGIVERSRYRT